MLDKPVVESIKTAAWRPTATPTACFGIMKIAQNCCMEAYSHTNCVLRGNENSRKTFDGNGSLNQNLLSLQPVPKTQYAAARRCENAFNILKDCR
jgi:hypothetical protein